MIASPTVCALSAGGGISSGGNFNGFYNVKAYGALGNGTGDDERAFSAALAAATAGQPVYAPPGTYQIKFPIWVRGNGRYPWKAALQGAGGFTGATVIKTNGNMPALFVAPFDGLSGVNAGAGLGVLWTSPLVGVVGQSMVFNGNGMAGNGTSWFLSLKEPLGLNTSDTPFKGLVQFDIQFWGDLTSTTNTGGSYWIRSSGNDGTATNANSNGSMSVSYEITHSGASDCIEFALYTSSGAANSGCVGKFASNTTHFFEGSYDGRNLRVFIDGTQAGTNVAETGNTVDYSYVSFLVGSGGTWPPNGANGPQGEMYGLRISNTARNTKNYTAPTAALSCDSHTLILLNGTTVNSDEGVSSTSGPFVAPECLDGVANPANTWIPMRLAGVTSGMNATISGIEFTGGSAEQYSLMGNQVQNSWFSDLFSNAVAHTGFLVENQSYFNNWTNIQAQNAYNTAFMFLWPAQTCTGCSGLGHHYGLVDFGGNTIISMALTPPAAGLACIVSNNKGDNFVTEYLLNGGCDNENGSHGPTLSVQGYVESVGQLFVGHPLILIGDNSSLKLTKPIFYPGGGSLVQVGYGVSHLNQSTVVFDQPNIATPGTGIINNPTALVDNSSLHYSVTSPGAGALVGTTAGSVTWTFPTFTDVAKTLVVTLNGYENTTATAQLFMLPAGLSSLGTAAADTGRCSGVTIGTGANTGCTAAFAPYRCCIGSGKGTCNTLQFVTLPSNMSGTQTGVCRANGN